MSPFVYEFEWDTLKAKTNLKKHGVEFENAAEVFRDPLALTIRDEEHSETELRWITMGKDSANRFVLIVHTFEEAGENIARIRLISARRPTKAEIRTYERNQ